MKSVIAAGLTGVLASLALITSAASAQQMFPAGGSSGTTCPGGSSYKGSGYCRANKAGQQFFPAGGSGGPLAQVGPVMRALVTARPAEQHDSQGQPPDQGVRSVGRSAGGGGWVVS